MGRRPPHQRRCRHHRRHRLQLPQLALHLPVQAPVAAVRATATRRSRASGRTRCPIRTRMRPRAATTLCLTKSRSCRRTARAASTASARLSRRRTTTTRHSRMLPAGATRGTVGTTARSAPQCTLARSAPGARARRHRHRGVAARHVPTRARIIKCSNQWRRRASRPWRRFRATTTRTQFALRWRLTRLEASRASIRLGARSLVAHCSL